MSGASSIAIFLLATTLRNSIDNRIVPIAATWGAGFEHLYFVMGTNIVDKKYLDSSCEIQPILSHRLLARAPQLQPQNELLEYQCIPGGLPIRVLFTANCTGTYFGIGPTCRCQESMRFFWTAPRFRDTQWFMFIDDDLYIRRLPLMTMLSGFNDRLHEPISIIRMSNQFPGVQLRGIRNRSECWGQFRLAMPAILNRRAVSEMAASVTANGMTRTQHVWGGSHDAILGMMLWLHQTPLYPVSFAYRSDRMKAGSLATFQNDYTEVLERAIIVHDVKGEIGLVSQAEVHAFYSNLTHSQRTKSIGDTTLNQLMSSKEIALGKEVYAQIVMLHAKIRQEPISKAILAFRKKFGDELSSKFHLFEQKYCDPDFFLKEGGEKI